MQEILDLLTAFGMLATVGTLCFALISYRLNHVKSEGRRVREVALKIERDTLALRGLVSESLYSYVSQSIADEMVSEAKKKEDMNELKVMLNADDNLAQHFILLGIEKSGRYQHVLDKLSQYQSMPLHIKEDLPIISIALENAVGLLAQALTTSVSPTLYNMMIDSDNIQKFFDVHENLSDLSNLQGLLAVYFSEGPNQYQNSRGDDLVKNSASIVTDLVRLIVDMSDGEIMKQRNFQKGILKQFENTGTYTGDIRKCVGLIEDVIPRNIHISITDSIARIEAKVGNNES